VYKEIYKRRIPDPQQALMIQDYTLQEESFIYNFADPSMWTTRSVDTQVISTADVYMNNGIYLTPADNSSRNKIAKAHASMVPMPNGLQPVRFFRKGAKVSIELLPTIVYDESNPDTIADGQEDHVWDCFTYGLTNWVPPRIDTREIRKKKETLGRLSGMRG